MSFGSGEPRVYLLNIETGQREVVGNFPGMTFAPRFSPDGQRVIMSLQQGGNSNIFVMDLRSQADDAADRHAGDRHRAVLFAGRRAHLLRVAIAAARSRSTSWAPSGGAAQRISFGEGRYSTPVWSPRGDYIAFTKQGGGSFAIGIMKPDGSGERILTEGYPQRRPDLRAERPRADVLPRAGRQRRARRSTRSTSPAATSSGCRRRALPPTRPGRRCCREAREPRERATSRTRSRPINHDDDVSGSGGIFRGRDNASSRLMERSLNEAPGRPGRKVRTTPVSSNGGTGMTSMLRKFRGAGLAAALDRGARAVRLRQQAGQRRDGLGRRADAGQPAGLRRQRRRPRVLRNRFHRADAAGARHARQAGAVAAAVRQLRLHHRRPRRRARHARIQHRARRPPRPGGARLSRRRAASSADRMRTISYGKERPVAVCNDISCWSQNRRAVTVLGATS